jgi:hypothetical protein
MRVPVGQRRQGVGLPPFTILKGGYVVYESAGQEQQKYGDDFPGWRKQMKTGPMARTRRRLAQASSF